MNMAKMYERFCIFIINFKNDIFYSVLIFYLLKKFRFFFFLELNKRNEEFEINVSLYRE